MERSDPRRWAFVILTGLLLSGQARAQGPTVDTSTPALPGGPGSSLGMAPGAGSSALGSAPGSGGGSLSNSPESSGVLGGRAGVSNPKGIPTSITTPGGGQGPTALQMPVSAPQPAPVSPTSSPFAGTLDLPSQEDDGPPEGLTLEHAIDIALQRSLDLRQKFFEIPMARADILQASLRANPVFYQDGQLLQYKGEPFSRARPGGPQQFDTNITYPLDVSGKRLARTVVAGRAVKVLEALYQDAVRQRIDDVFGAYVQALNARQTMRYAEKSVKGFQDLTAQTRRLFESGGLNRVDYDRVRIQLRTTELGLVDARAAYRKARLDLGSFLNLTIDEATAMELRGSIQVEAPPPPPIPDLVKIALDERPDILSLRLGVSRAQADVKLAKANAFSDVYVLWQPYTFQDNSPYGLKSATSWALGVTVPLPIYNRNQGGIARAKFNVGQSQLQLDDLERQARIDIEEAVQEYEISRRLVDALHDEVIPEAKVMLLETDKLRRAGDKSISEYIAVQLEFNDKVKQYLDTAIRYRRSMLSINTVVGKRVMP
jgi:cobalt-zinc-cadmium efflux system outer membrane protein